MGANRQLNEMNETDEQVHQDFSWTDDSIRWMRDASQKSRYYAVIAERITAYLPPSSRVFDAGGGLGDLAIWLSYHVRHVTLIERDPKAVAVFRERCPQNVSAMLGDVFSYIPDQLYDALVLCSFGRPNEILPLARELTRGKTFVVQSAEAERTFSLNGARHSSTIQDVAAELQAHGVPYALEFFEVEHGQPFRSAQDAADFFSFYEKRPVRQEEIAARLGETGDAAFPYYCAAKRKLGLLSFEPVR